MPNSPNLKAQPSPEALELFHTTKLRTRVFQCAELLWKRRLNATEKKELGDTFERAVDEYPSAPHMWAKVKRISWPLAVIEVAETLELLSSDDADWLRREGGEVPRDLGDAMLVATERGDLVLSCRERRFHWKGQECEVSLQSRPVLWDFFLTVCRSAKRGKSVGWDSFGDGKRENYVTQTKSRLSKLPGFPMDLLDLFVGDGPHRQRLDLPAERIHIFD